ncbi:hypothetical protein BELL_0267g00080 [Botrytis elliptica]|uniref:Major facilitator superfamily (MFS) profile domain-containing protein n=1 Tax=Botrytis elliptica TaxID=278938 RepID=A0A4Z1JLJ7_9HELO|nr:hypothetical protein BELL_0267g00080 [Botrytis elliptica]
MKEENEKAQHLNDARVGTTTAIVPEVSATETTLLSSIVEATVDYEGPHDASKPRNWSKAYKWSLMLIISALSMTTNLTVLICAPAIPQILEEFRSASVLNATLILTIWNLGAAVGCLCMGPLSEMYGRRPVYNLANLLFLLCIIAETQSKNVAMVIVFRCLGGVSTATTALNPTIVGDIFNVEERGGAQSLLSLMPLIGPAIGPIFGGYIAQTEGWRWTFGLAGITSGTLSILFFLIYRESYDATILRRKAAKMRKEFNDPSIHSRYDEQGSKISSIVNSLVRPIKILVAPIFALLIFSMCLLSSYVYLLASTITGVFQTNYGFSEGEAGLAFLGLAIGMALGAILCSAVLDWYTKKMKVLHGGKIKPEWRLPPMTLGFVIAPIGLITYGWTTYFRVHYIVPVIGTALCGFATYTTVVPTTVYLVDISGIFRGSAMSAMTMSRNIMSTILPLAGPPLYRSLGLGWGNSVLAFIALSFAPLPFILLRYGERIRSKSRLEDWM